MVSKDTEGTKEKSRRSELWKRLNFKYKIAATNENTLEELWSLRASLFWGGLFFGVFVFLLILVTSVVIITTPIRYYLPGYLDEEVRHDALVSAMEVDAIEQKIKHQDAYIKNIKNIFAGIVDIDSVKSLDSVFVANDDPRLMKSEAEKEFVEKYVEDEMYNLSALVHEMDVSVGDVVFAKPVSGLLMQKFDLSAQRYGVKINLNKKEAISSILEGVVMFAGYDLNSGSSIQVQHSNGFVSFYKNNTLLLKKVGDKVQSGEAIALKEVVGNKKSDENYVLIELWFNGKPVDPQNYILF